jgi:hypothetical protein
MANKYTNKETTKNELLEFFEYVCKNYYNLKSASECKKFEGDNGAGLTYWNCCATLNNEVINPLKQILEYYKVDYNDLENKIFNEIDELHSLRVKKILEDNSIKE